jgi:phenylacetate-coenzyme A ligase PaaK-like adenylate-forming protein
MSFSERNKIGFKMGMKNGIDLFFGLSSVVARISEDFGTGYGGGFNPFKNSLKMNWKIIRAWLNSKVNNTPIMPKDIWNLKGLICAGTDSASYKDKIEKYWGIKPLEIFGGTEPTIVATQTWSKEGMVLFPDVCFYEFIPEPEMEKSAADSSYTPKTYLINELIEGGNYELVITNFKGGAFCRYRVGDIFKCISKENPREGIRYPQFAYVDRVPEVIDIAGFTRITEATISDSIKLSNLDISDWFAVKEYDDEKRVYMHLYIEIGANGFRGALAKDIIKEHLTIYFKYIDHDYKDLKKLLGIDPLVVTIIPAGTLEKFRVSSGRSFRRMNPGYYDVTEVLKIANGGKGGY